MRRSALGALSLILVAMTARPSAGWDAATTHAGLTEQAALASSLHTRLIREHARPQGLYQQLVIPPQDAPELFAVLRRLNPIHGYVPDQRGRQTAMAWLVAGSVIADSTDELAAQHFFDPRTGNGLNKSGLAGLTKRIRMRLTAALGGDRLPPNGGPAPDWIVAKDNPFNLAGFHSQYVKSITSRTPGERDRHLAGALVAAGAMLHVLEDMGSPSHVRGDIRAHFDRLGPEASDTGSRFEYVAALAFGRLGVPAPAAPVADRPLRSFFTAEDSSGLADRIHRSWFSAYTLPRPLDLGSDPVVSVRKNLPGTVRRALPAPGRHLDLASGRQGKGELRTTSGVCLAKYRIDSRRLSWFIDDRCAVEQIAAILPTVGAYATGMLDSLFRGSLAIEGDGSTKVVRVGSVALGAGTLRYFADDARGVRSEIGKADVPSAAAGAVLGQMPAAPSGARALTVLFEGQSADGRPLVATGTTTVP